MRQRMRNIMVCQSVAGCCKATGWKRSTGGLILSCRTRPILRRKKWQRLRPEVALHEPHLALTDGGDGLSAYRVIAGQAAGYLAEAGRVIVEIGARQGAAVEAIFRTQAWGSVEVLPDLDGRDRVVVARNPA